MNRAKQRKPRKSVQSKRAIHSSPHKKKEKAAFPNANGGHIKGGNDFLHEDATACHVHSPTVLDVATPPVLEFEAPVVDEATPPETSEELAHIERLNSTPVS